MRRTECNVNVCSHSQRWYKGKNSWQVNLTATLVHYSRLAHREFIYCSEANYTLFGMGFAEKTRAILILVQIAPTNILLHILAAGFTFVHHMSALSDYFKHLRPRVTKICIHVNVCTRQGLILFKKDIIWIYVS